MNSSIYCIGETMCVFTSADDAPLSTSTALLPGVGGAESNVAVHLAGAGHETTWLSRVGADSFGDRILATVGASGVNTEGVIRDHVRPTGIYFKDHRAGDRTRVHYYRGGSAASALSLSDWDTWNVPETAWVHLSGITPALSASCAELVSGILAGPNPVSFDVNYRPALWPVEIAGPTLRDLADRAELVFVGLDEAELLWGISTAEDIAALVPGADTIVVKDGAVDAVELGRTPVGLREITRVPALSVDVLEPVGAGDAFAAGYLSALLAGGSADDRLASGHRFAVRALVSLHDAPPAPEGEVVG